MALDGKKDASGGSAPSARGWRSFGVALFVLLGVAASAALLWAREADSPSPGVTGVFTNAPRGVSSLQVSSAFAPPAAQAAFSGTVRSAAGGPLAGADVCAACAGCRSAEMPALACTRTDERGAYALSSRNVRAVVISAAAAGYQTGYAHGGAPLAVQAEARSRLDIVLQPGGAMLRGTVVDALGGPIARARVLVERNEHGIRSVHETRTADDGRFALATARGFQTLRAEHEDYAPRSKGVTAPASEVELQLTPASTLRGRVQQRGSGEPVGGVEVRALPEGFPAQTAAALSDEDGSFVLRGLEPGRYLLSAQSEVWRGGSGPWVEVRLAELIEDVVIEVAPAVRVLGFVKETLKGGDKPCPHGLVALDPAFAPESGQRDPARAGQGGTAPIDVDGLVRFRGVSPGRYDVSVHCPDHVLLQGPTQLEVADRELKVEWTVGRGLALTVNVVDAAGKPVPNLPLTLASEHHERPGVQRVTTIVSDESGSAVIRNELLPGKYTARPAQGVEGEPVSVLLKDGSPPAELTLRLSGSGSIVVSVQDEAGRPVNGLQVGANPISGPTLAPAPSTAAPAALAVGRELLAVEEGDGRYRVGPLTAGTYDVRVEDGVNHEPETRVQVAAGAVPVRVVLRRDGVVRGVVVDQHGDPEANAWVSASPEGKEASPMAKQRFMLDPPGRVLTDADGRFELSGLRPGARYTIKAKQPYDNAAVLHDIEVGQAIRIVVPSSASLAGVVLNPQGRPAVNAIVKARHGDTNTTRTTRTQPDGSFFLDRIPAGRVELSAAAMALGHARLELELQPGGRVDRQTLSLAPPALQPSASRSAEAH